MIAANVQAAQRLGKARLPTLYRVHEGPNPDRFEELALVLGSFGFKLPPPGKLEPGHLSRILNRMAGKIIVDRITESLETKARFTMVLSGGSTPKSLYGLLATDPWFRERIVWQKVHFFWGDERHVPPDHPESNYRMAYEAMLSKAPVPPANIHRVPAEHPDAKKSAEEYQQELLRFFRLEAGRLPRFDVLVAAYAEIEVVRA